MYIQQIKGFSYSNKDYNTNNKKSDKSKISFQAYSPFKLEKLRQTAIKNIKPQNLSGEGKNSKVYRFIGPQIDKYVIRVFKKRQKKKNKLNKPCKIELPKFNFGQAVIKLTNEIYLLKRQLGVQHGINNWCDVVSGKAELTEQQAIDFSNSIKKISQMPDSTFENYAEKTKYLTENRYKFDSQNPNNLLIDYKKNEINIIDVNKFSRSINQDNTYLDMVAGILDGRLFRKFLKTLPDEASKKDMMTSANTIVEKCRNAAVKTGLGLEIEPYERYIEKVADFFHVVGEDMEKFYNLLKIDFRKNKPSFKDLQQSRS